jgi:hypothetical protein
MLAQFVKALAAGTHPEQMAPTDVAAAPPK